MLNIEILWDAVHSVTGITKEKMQSPSRKWPVVEARMLFILFMGRCGETHEKISLLLKRTRSNITQIMHNAEGYIEISKDFQGKYTKLKDIYERTQSVRLSQD